MKENEGMKNNIIVDKSNHFAGRIIKLHKYIIGKGAFNISNQILRSGTSIGANIAEAQGAQSKADFIAKMHIALKECKETQYWLNLLKNSDVLTEREHSSIMQDLSEINIIIVRILKTAKQNIHKS